MKVIACVILVLASSATRASGIGLLQSWRSAKDHDPAFAVAQSQLETGRAYGSMANALWSPTLVATGEAGRSSVSSSARGAHFYAPGFGSTGGVDFQTDTDSGNATHWALIAEQPLLDAARTAHSTTYRNTAQMADARFRQVEQDLMVRTARAYFDVLSARALRATLRALRVSAERTRAEAQARYDAGDIPATDMREAQARADAVGVQELDAATAVILAEATYTDLTGLDALDLGTLPEAATEGLPVSEALDVWMQRVVGNSPQLRIRELALDTARAESARYKVLADARVSLIAQMEHESLAGSGEFGATDSSSRQQSISLQFTLPLFTGGMRSAQRREARSLVDQAEAELNNSILQIRQQTRSAWLASTTAAARVAALKRLRLSTGSRLDATRLGTEIGSRNTIELLNAEAEFQRSGTDFQRAQIDWLLQILQLKALAGELRESDLAQLDGRLGV